MSSIIGRFDELSSRAKIIIVNILIIIATFILGRTSYYLVLNLEGVVFPIYLPVGFTFLFIYKRNYLNSIGVFIGTYLEATYNIYSIFGNLSFISFISILFISVSNTVLPLLASILLNKFTSDKNIL